MKRDRNNREVSEGNMGILKDLQLEQEERDKREAEERGWTCARCGDFIQIGEEDVYDRSHFCSYCEHVMEKND